MEPVEIFGFDTRVVQVFATLIAAAATGFVAIVAARIAHQNAFGLPPMILTTAYGGGAGEKPFVSGRFLVWNRRKHAIELYVARVVFARTKLAASDEIDGHNGNWRSRKRGELAEYIKTLKLGANESHEFNFELPVEYDGDEIPRVVIRYLDPAAGRIKERSNRGNYMIRMRFWLRSRPAVKYKQSPWLRWPHK